MAKVFLEDFEHYKTGRWVGAIDWAKSIGKAIRFEYDNEIENFLLLSDGKRNENVFISYNGEIYKTWRKSILGNHVFSVIKGDVKLGYVYDIGEIITFENGLAIKILDRKTENGKSRYKYECLKCGNVDWTYGSIIWRNKTQKSTGNCCSVCSGRKVATGINDIPTVAPWMIPYFQGGYDEARLYTTGTSKRIIPRCPDCGKIHTKSLQISHIYMNGFACSYCSDSISYPNKFMANVLEQLSIDFETEYSPNWLKPYKYDFCIPNLMLIIEMDGGLGHGKRGFNGKVDKLGLKRDQTKDTLAREHKFRIIRINSDVSDKDYLKNNIVSALNNIFSLKNIIWEECDRYATSNLVKTICDDYCLNKRKPSEIAEKYHVCHATVINYLKRGAELGWCDYTPATFHNVGRTYTTIMKKVYAYCGFTGKKLKEYKSITEASNCSKKDFGTDISISIISMCCNGKSTNCKGIIYSYKDVEIMNTSNVKYISERPVKCFDLSGNYLNTYQSLKEASDITGVNAKLISNCCNGYQKSAGGFKWEYVTEIQLLAI